MVVSLDSFKGVNERFNQIVSITLSTQISMTLVFRALRCLNRYNQIFSIAALNYPQKGNIESLILKKPFLKTRFSCYDLERSHG